MIVGRHPVTPADRTYRTAAFAALAGVTARALHHYDRLGLLKPKRSSAGYRLYSERDLQTLEEIVALKFIGVPLRKIAALRRGSRARFADVLGAQRVALESKRGTLTRAIEAIGAAEAALRSGTQLDATVFRRIIEVMHMDRNHEDTLATYSSLLKAKLAHLSALSESQRAALHKQWEELVTDVKAAVGEDPGTPKAQALLDRWVGLLQALTGTRAATLAASGADAAPFSATSELRDQLWARRAEWLSSNARPGAEGTGSEDALARARKRAERFADPAVVDFMKRARAARG